MKIVFCGTPDFAVPSLRGLLTAGHEVSLVLTRPDRAAGRGLDLHIPAVKVLAQERGLRVTQPLTIKRNEELRMNLESLAPDVIVVVAFGRLIPEWMLALPRFGNINVHGSLLPKYRGAAPIQWAIARGDRVTGVTTMRLDTGLDTGDLLLARDVPIPHTALAKDISPILAEVGADLLLETLRGLSAGTLYPVAQEHAHATLAPPLTRNDGRMDFGRTASELYDRWRGFYPWPGAHTNFRANKLIVHRMSPAARNEVNEPLEMTRQGELLSIGRRLLVVCGGMSVLALDEVQLAGKHRMEVADFLHGYQVKQGECLG